MIDKNKLLEIKSARIRCFDWRVIWTDQPVELDGSINYGYCDIGNLQITLFSEVPPNMMFYNLLHELWHSYCAVYMPKGEEAHANCVQEFIIQLFRDNPKLKEFL